MSDGSDSAPAVDQAVPRLISGVAERGDGTDAGADDRIVGGGASGGGRRSHRSILSEAEEFDLACCAVLFCLLSVFVVDLLPGGCHRQRVDEAVTAGALEDGEEIVSQQVSVEFL